MKVRFRSGILGTFCSVDGGVNRGDILDLPDHIALGLLRTGQAQSDLTGTLVEGWTPGAGEKEIAAIEAKITGRQPKPPPPAEPARHLTKEEKEAFSW